MTYKNIITFFLLLASGFQVFSQSLGGITSGAALYCDSTNSGFISLNSYNGQIVCWEFSEDNHQTWKILQNTTSTQSYNKLKRTTAYRAIVKDGQFLSDTSSVSTITVYVRGNAGNLVGGGLFCEDAGTGTINIYNAPGDIESWQYSIDKGSSWNTINSHQSSLTYTSVTKHTLYRSIVKTVAGCPNDTTKNISFIIDSKSIAGSISKSDSLCYGSPGDTLKLEDFNGTVIAWYSSYNDGKNWDFINDTIVSLSYPSVTQSIWYKAIVKSGSCASTETKPAVIAVYNKLPAHAGEDLTITRNEKISLHAQGIGKPQWNPSAYLSDSLSLYPLADPINSTQYVLTITDDHGCLSSDTMNITVLVPIPTVITPNNDGVNDFFIIDELSTYEHNSLSIINRWGIEVYKASPYLNNWNGKSLSGNDLPDDVYYFVFDPGNGENAKTNYILIQR